MLMMVTTFRKGLIRHGHVFAVSLKCFEDVNNVRVPYCFGH